MKGIYLDNNSTTRIDDGVKAAMDRYDTEFFGNPNSLHMFGAQAREGLRKAVDQIYAALGADDEDDVIVTAGATESNNTVLKSLLRRDRNGKLIGDRRGRLGVVISSVEHPAISVTCEYLESQGIPVTVVPLNEDGIITPENLDKCIDPEKTALVSVMWANNETGLVNPIKELAEVAHRKGVYFHTDAVQAVGKIPINVQEVGVDMLSASAHKFHGPKGVGLLYINHRCKWLSEYEGYFTPLLHGGEQMANRRAGTINVPGVVGMGAAIELADKHARDPEVMGKMIRLRNKLEDYLLTIPGVKVIGRREIRTPNTILASFRGVEGEAMLWDLNQFGIAASTGSACASESLQANPTFDAMAVDPELSHTGIRFSLSHYTTDEEIDRTIEAVGKAVTRLRNISGIY